MHPQELVAAAPAPVRQVADTVMIDLLAIDLETCDRCVGTDHSLETALGLVHDVLAATGATVEVRKTLVETVEQARALRLVSSPTIRIDGRDIALELKETACGAEACRCGDEESIACRVWSYRGREYTEAPVGLIVDAILGELYGGAARPKAPVPQTYDLPENLEAFFAGESERSKEHGSCCSPAEQASCCEQSAKASCCGPSPGGGCACR